MSEVVLCAEVFSYVSIESGTTVFYSSYWVILFTFVSVYFDEVFLDLVNIGGVVVTEVFYGYLNVFCECCPVCSYAVRRVKNWLSGGYVRVSALNHLLKGREVLSDGSS